MHETKTEKVGGNLAAMLSNVSLNSLTMVQGTNGSDVRHQ